MKFKTVSEFIYALEVEGKKFVHPHYPDDYFIEWREGYPQEIPIDPDDVSSVYGMDCFDLTYDWQEYKPEPETEEVELEEWMWKGSSQYNFYYTDWIRAGHEHFAEDAFKTGVTRKVRVPK